MERLKIESYCTFVLSISVMFILIVFVFAIGTGIAAQDKSIKIGLSLSYTGAGSEHGHVFGNGGRDRLLWLNEKEGGITYRDPKTGKNDQVKINVVWEDNAYDPSKSLASYKRFRAAGVKLISGYGSSCGEVMAGSASVDKIPIMFIYTYPSPAGYSPKPQFYASGLGTITEDYMAPAKWFISKWKENRRPRLGALVLNIPSWRIFADPNGVRAHVTELGGEFVGEEWLPIVCTDSSIEVRRLVEEKKADFIMLFGMMPHANVVAKDMARLGVNLNKVTVVFNASAIQDTFAKNLPKESEGIYGTNYFSLPYETDVPGVKTVWKIATWRGRDSSDVTKAYIEGYACSRILEIGLKASLEKVGFDALTTTDIRDSFFSLKDLTLDGLIPSITMRDPSFPGYVYWMRLARCSGGNYRVASDWLQIPLIKQWGR